MAKTKEVKREEAKARQEAYDKLTLDQKIERAKAEGGKKVLAKLEAKKAKA